jgi:hypothetical protein
MARYRIEIKDEGDFSFWRLIDTVAGEVIADGDSGGSPDEITEAVRQIANEILDDFEDFEVRLG